MTTRSVPAGSAVSACHTIDGDCPDTSFSVRAMSRSRLMPGKTRTDAFIGLSSQHFHPVILDHGVGQELVGGLLEQRLRFRLVAAFQFDVEHLALAHTGDAGDAQRAQSALDGLALRVEDA